MTDSIIETYPREIWLQNAEPEADEPAPYTCHAVEEMTWAPRQFEISDIPYVRADIAHDMALRSALQNCLRELHKYRDAFHEHYASVTNGSLDDFNLLVLAKTDRAIEEARLALGMAPLAKGYSWGDAEAAEERADAHYRQGASRRHREGGGGDDGKA